MPRFRVLAAVVAAVLMTTGCTLGSPGPTPNPSQATRPQPQTALPADETTVLPATGGAELALLTSQALFVRAPAVVLAGDGDEASLTDATSTAANLGVPVLLTPGSDTALTAAITTELTRLGTTTLVTVGSAAAQWAGGGAGTSASATPASTSPKGMVVVALTGDGAALPDLTPARPLTDLLVLALDQAASRAAVATARAAGARVQLVHDPDPRADDKVISALAGQSTTRVLALGSSFGPAPRLRQRVNTAATGVLLPGGGQVVFPGRRMVALYGHPGDSVLGVLGEQPLSAAITRAKNVAASYSSLVDEPVVPTFEIITTVASASAGSDGDYSLETPVERLRPWVDAARAAGMYVMLDLQPGRTDFLTQAKRYAELLKLPNVGLALDPEWRLKPNQVHMVQIGSVTADEINATSEWLAELTRVNKLPQKVLMLHQFRLDMIVNRSSVNTSHDELSIIIHADGFGTPSEKFNTWRAMHVNPPANISWGWKNFYDEDQPTFTPRQTVAISPSPVFVSYQ
ncbi:MAG: hypothetical protein ACM30G_22975 [Micromonosporaceae bacterium]